MVILPMMSLRSGPPDKDLIAFLPPKKHLFYTNGLVLLIGASLVLTAWNISGRPWHIFGFKWPIINNTVIWAIVAVVVLYVGDVVVSLIFKDRESQKIEEISYIIPQTWTEYKHYIFLALAAGIGEEIVYRGYLMNYILEVGKTFEFVWWMALIIPALAFATGHIYQGWLAVIKIFIMALLFGIIFLYSGSLFIVIVLHTLVDLVSGMAGILFAKSDDKKYQFQNADEEE